MNSWGHLLQKKVFPKKSRLLSWREMAIFVNLRWRKKIICIDLSVGNSIKAIDTLFFFPWKIFLQIKTYYTNQYMKLMQMMISLSLLYLDLDHAMKLWPLCTLNRWLFYSLISWSMGLHDQIQGAIKLIKEASGFDFNRRQPFLFFQVAFLHSCLGPFHVAKRLLNSYKIGNNFFEYRSMG